MRYLIVLPVLLLQGCPFFFFYIPGSVIDKLSGWNACAGEQVKVGERLVHEDGRIGMVERISGRSDRCRSFYRPILVEVSFSEERK